MRSGKIEKAEAITQRVSQCIIPRCQSACSNLQRGSKQMWDKVREIRGKQASCYSAFLDCSTIPRSRVGDKSSRCNKAGVAFTDSYATLWVVMVQQFMPVLNNS